MKTLLMKYKKSISIILGIVIIVPLAFFSGNGLGIKAAEIDHSDDERIAAEISNMTGVKIEEILDLRKQKKTWQDILEELKVDPDSVQSLNAEERTQYLTEMGMDEELLKELSNQFSNDEILETRLLVERLVFQLQEITKKDGGLVEKPTTNTNNIGNVGEDDLKNYEELLEKFNTDKAIYFALKLELELGSKEAVLDEYLLSLQLEIDLQLYLENKDQYLKEKEEKSLGMIQDEIINLMKIEEKMLKKIQEENALNEGSPVEVETPSVNGNQNSNGETSIQAPLPEIPNVKPVNPANEIMKEINVIDPNKNIGGLKHNE